MNEEHITALKEHIIKDLEAEGVDVSGDFSKMLWQSPRSLRLRLFGFNVLKKYYKFVDFPLEDIRLTGRELMTLKYKVAYPYYLPTNHSHLSLFTIKQSFVLKLNGGDVKKWLADLDNKSS